MRTLPVTLHLLIPPRPPADPFADMFGDVPTSAPAPPPQQFGGFQQMPPQQQQQPPQQPQPDMFGDFGSQVRASITSEEYCV